VKRYVEAHYGADLGLEAIASALRYSPNHLNHLFKQDTGETICDFVCRYRVQKAKEMLADPRMRLYEIAESLGYRNAAYFSGIFKRHSGLTPKEYRERCTR
jgi:two-component system, response regulator YesN